MAPLIFIFGLIGNILGFIVVLIRKNLIKIGPIIMYRLLFTMNIIVLIFMIITYLGSAFNFDLTITSKYACKLYWYLSLCVFPIPRYILIYISFEKIISIKYPTRTHFLRTTETQIIYFLILISFNSVYNLTSLFVLNLIEITNSTTTTTTTSLKIVCYTNNYHLFQITDWMDIVNRVILPTVLMILTSIIFLNSIWNLNQRIAQNFGTNQNIKKQINRIVSLLILNVCYISFSLPISIVAFYFQPKDIQFLASYYFSFLFGSVNFYVILFTNSLFRKEFILIF